MPMELYTSEAFVRDLVNAISQSEGKPLNIGGNHHADIDRSYAYQLIADAKKAVEGNPVPTRRVAARTAASPQRFIPKAARQQIAASTPRKQPAKVGAQKR